MGNRDFFKWHLFSEKQWNKGQILSETNIIFGNREHETFFYRNQVLTPSSPPPPPTHTPHPHTRAHPPFEGLGRVTLTPFFALVFLSNLFACQVLSVAFTSVARLFFFFFKEESM